jgi:hypothetical protein
MIDIDLGPSLGSDWPLVADFLRRVCRDLPDARPSMLS